MTDFATTLPADSLKIGHIPQWFRDVQIIMRDLLQREHGTIAGTYATITGAEHKAGSAKAYHGDYSVDLPTKRPDGSTNLSADDAGRIAWDTDGDELHVHNGTAWESVYDKFLALERTFADALNVTGDLAVTGGIAVNTDKFTVAAATGNTVVAGTLDLGGDVDFNQHEAKQFVLEVLSEDPASPATGQMWFIEEA